MIDILIFAAVAIYLVIKLRGILGQDAGIVEDNNVTKIKDVTNTMNTTSGYTKRSKRSGLAINIPSVININKANNSETIDNAAEDEIANLPDSIKQTLRDIIVIDPAFVPSFFINGAKSAFELILDSYTKGDVETLSSLLGSKILSAFSEKVAERVQDRLSEVNLIVSILSADVVDAQLVNKIATIDVKFISEQINYSEDKDSGTMVRGSKHEINIVEEVWSFSRDLMSQNNVWLLIETRNA